MTYTQQKALEIVLDNYFKSRIAEELVDVKNITENAITLIDAIFENQTTPTITTLPHWNGEQMQPITALYTSTQND